jgi:hypothetical protein
VRCGLAHPQSEVRIGAIQHDILFPIFQYPSSCCRMRAQISPWTLMMSFFQTLNFTTAIQRLPTAGFVASSGFGSNQTSQPSPIVNVLNGSYIGAHNEFYNQDLFLGIPYAQPPVETLRFRAPVPLNAAWNGAREAVKYSDIVSPNLHVQRFY